MMAEARGPVSSTDLKIVAAEVKLAVWSRSKRWCIVSSSSRTWAVRLCRDMTDRSGDRGALFLCESAPATEADGIAAVTISFKVFVFPLVNLATFLTVRTTFGELVVASTGRDVLSTIFPVPTTPNEAVMGNGMGENMGKLLLRGQAGKIVGKLEQGKEANACLSFKVCMCESRLRG